jgi:hypothetical protein
MTTILNYRTLNSSLLKSGMDRLIREAIELHMASTEKMA